MISTGIVSSLTAERDQSRDAHRSHKSDRESKAKLLDVNLASKLPKNIGNPRAENLNSENKAWDVPEAKFKNLDINPPPVLLPSKIYSIVLNDSTKFEKSAV